MGGLGGGLSDMFNEELRIIHYHPKPQSVCLPLLNQMTPHNPRHSQSKSSWEGPAILATLVYLENVTLPCQHPADEEALKLLS